MLIQLCIQTEVLAKNTVEQHLKTAWRSRFSETVIYRPPIEGPPIWLTEFTRLDLFETET